MSKSNPSLKPDHNLSDEALVGALSPGLGEATVIKSDKHIGRILNSYRIELKLGEGGMGKVYLARHQVIGKRACIKICNSAEGSSFDDRFLREAKILAQLEHPNLITAFDFGRFEGGQFILMPYINAMSLSDLLKSKKKLSAEECVDMVVQAAKGLHAAHVAGVVHRDVKPGNLLIDSDGKVWVSDFGISLFSGSEASSFMTRAGETLGSPSYIAPEQIEGQQVDHRADIYALGATLFHLLYETPPFNADSPMLVLRKHLDEALVFPDTVQEQLPKALVVCVEKMLAKNPDQRYQSMVEVSNALEKAMKTTATTHCSTISVRLSEQTLQQVLHRSREIEKREKEMQDKLSLKDLHEIGTELDIPIDRLDKARREIADEKRRGVFKPDPKKDTIANKVMMIDQLWLIMAISILGLFVPVINLAICEYISLYMLWKMCQKAEVRMYAPFCRAGNYAIIALILYGLSDPLKWLTLVDRDFAIFGFASLILQIIALIFSFRLIWNIFAGVSELVGRDERSFIDRLHACRVKYILAVLALVVISSILVNTFGHPYQSQGMPPWMIIYLTLPICWFIGWRYILSPLKSAKKLLLGTKDIYQTSPFYLAIAIILSVFYCSLIVVLLL